EKLMFRVLKRGAELDRARSGGGELADMALRFDLTVPLARYYATHRGELPAVFKRYQIGPVWRAERAQHGRYREFVQCDVDVLGSPSMAVEAEVILATTTALARLGFAELVVRLNARPLLALLVRSCGVPEEHLGAAVIGIDKLDKETSDAVAAELDRKGVPQPATSALLELHARSRAAGDAGGHVGAPRAARPRGGGGRRRPAAGDRGGGGRGGSGVRGADASGARPPPAAALRPAGLRPVPRARHGLLHRLDLRDRGRGRPLQPRRRRPLRRAGRAPRRRLGAGVRLLDRLRARLHADGGARPVRGRCPRRR